MQIASFEGAARKRGRKTPRFRLRLKRGYTPAPSAPGLSVVALAKSEGRAPPSIQFIRLAPLQTRLVSRSSAYHGLGSGCLNLLRHARSHRPGGLSLRQARALLVFQIRQQACQQTDERQVGTEMKYVINSRMIGQTSQQGGPNGSRTKCQTEK